ncbi:hypothetical protein C4D60_Mb10t24460 [Musa balbisiana]|uniref:Uncharacterized protein n=1 Tax=Musa balbisiana TaxID=52838 RepID=A0A4S8IZE7_MUSBA|nr:hypothetical protein C4D60_Mb10t24460 [Musa balbisiana]
MEHALRLANIDPQRTPRGDSLTERVLQVFFDDSARNIRSGKRIGLQTVLVGLFGMNWVGALQSSSCPCPTSLSFVGGWMQVGTSHRVKGADHALESIHNIREALPELWEKAEKSGSIRHSGKVAMETSVTA